MTIHNTCIMSCRHSTQTAVHFREADKLDSYSEALIIADHASEKFQASSKGCVKAESLLAAAYKLHGMSVFLACRPSERH